MKSKSLELKEEIKQLASDIKVLKYKHRENSSNGYMLCPWVIKNGYYNGNNIKFLLERGWVNIDSVLISDDILSEFKDIQKVVLQDYCLLVEKQFLYRHLSIAYGLLRGKTREQIEPKWKENPSPYNPITKKYILGKDPVDWDFISELKKKYSEEYAKTDNVLTIGDCTVA